MTAPSYDLRPAAPADAAALAGLRAHAIPYFVQSTEGMRARLGDAELSGAWCVEVAGEVTGYAMCRTPYERTSRLTVLVSPDHRRNGIGTALVRVAEEHAVGIGATAVGSVANDELGAEFAVACGYQLGGEHRFAAAEIAKVPAASPVPAGCHVVPLGEVDPYDVWTLHELVAGDDPSGMTISQPFDTWRAEDWDFPDHAPDLGVGVRAGSELVAFTHVFADRDRRRIWSAMTGVRRDHRGRGLARLVKSISLTRARGEGMIMAFTGNDAANAPMLAVNEFLGYRLAGRAWSVRRSLA